MPTYDYVCKHCGVHEERFRTMSKRNKLAVCTECHHNMERVMSVPQPFVFRAPRDIRPYVDRVKESYERDPPKTNKRS